MQPRIVRVRVDFGRLILEWAMIAVVTLSTLFVIGFTRTGVKPDGPVPFSAWVKSAGIQIVPPGKESHASEGNTKGSSTKPFDPNPAIREGSSTKPFDPDQALRNAGIITGPETRQQAQFEYQEYADQVFPLDYTKEHLYALSCFLFGVVALVLTGLYAPWLGWPEGDADKPSDSRPMLVAAGYGWLWRSGGPPVRLPAKQTEK